VYETTLTCPFFLCHISGGTTCHRLLVRGLFTLLTIE
jgi:hypothetical protein